MAESTPHRAPALHERAWTSPLAFSLYGELSGAPGNLLFSPYSLVGALMVAWAGAGGGTRLEIESVLRRREKGATLAASFGELLRGVGHVARPGSGLLDLLTANALWCQVGCPVRSAFVEVMRARFGAEAGEVDFIRFPAEAVRTINAWASEATRGRITTLVDEEQVGTLTRGMLANLASFTAPWPQPFDSGCTRRGTFQLPSGRPVDLPMMHGGGTLRYLRAGHAHALHVPYAVSRVRMLLLLPDPGCLGAVEKELEAGLYGEVLRKAEPRTTSLVLPRCHVTCTRSLREPLGRLGLASAFGPEADFSRVSDERGVFLGDLLHRAFVGIGEYGTEAAASTTQDLVAGRAERPDEVVDFRVDRPFLFLICDAETETVFFMGRVTDPRG